MKFPSIVFSVLIFALLTACGAPKDDAPSAKTSPYFQMQDKLVSVDGLEIRYREEGPKTGQPLILVHGFTSSLESWDLLAADLSSDYRVIRLDLPGHGLTGADPEKRYSVEETAVFLQHFLQALNIENPVIIGNSLGGLVAWRLAALAPESVSKLVLISPGGFSINGVTENPVDVPLMLKVYLKQAPMAGVKQATQALFADPDKLPEDRISEIRDLMLHGENGEAFIHRLEVFTLPDPSQDLAKVTTPTLLIWGEKDVMVPPEHGNRFKQAMPNARLITYPETGHIPQEEAPKQLALDIRKFLQTEE